MHAWLNHPGVFQGAGFEFDVLRVGRVEMVEAVAAIGAKSSTVDVATVGKAFPEFQFAMKGKRAGFYHSRYTERTGRQLLALAAMAGNHF